MTTTGPNAPHEGTPSNVPQIGNEELESIMRGKGLSWAVGDFVNEACSARGLGDLIKMGDDHGCIKPHLEKRNGRLMRNFKEIALLDTEKVSPDIFDYMAPKVELMIMAIDDIVDKVNALAPKVLEADPQAIETVKTLVAIAFKVIHFLTPTLHGRGTKMPENLKDILTKEYHPETIGMQLSKFMAVKNIVTIMGVADLMAPEDYAAIMLIIEMVNRMNAPAAPDSQPHEGEIIVDDMNKKTFDVLYKLMDDRTNDFLGLQCVMSTLREAKAFGEDEEAAKTKFIELLTGSIDKKSGVLCRSFEELSPLGLKEFPEKIQIMLTALDDLANQINKQQADLLNCDDWAMHDVERLSTIALRIMSLFSYHENRMFRHGDYEPGTPEAMVLEHIGSIDELARKRSFVNAVVFTKASIIRAKGPAAGEEEIRSIEHDMLFTEALFDAVNKLKGAKLIGN